MNKKLTDLFWSFGSSLFISLLVFLIGDVPAFGSMISFFLLAIIGIYVLIRLYRLLGPNKLLCWIMILAFSLRIGFGIFSTYGLPIIGYDQKTQQEGYLFRDAYNRDLQAWKLAGSEEPIWIAFGSEFFSDQYGGLLAISAFIYRYSSPFFHLKILITLLAVIISVIGIPFVWNMPVKHQGVNVLATLIYAFYPDAILFSSSQMREPFLMGLSAILFWLAISKRLSRQKRLIFSIIISLFMLVLSTRTAVFIILFAIIWSFMESQEEKAKKIPFVFLALSGFLILVSIGILSWGWIIEASKWDAILAVQKSGWIKFIFSRIPEILQLPFLSVYGLTQPVLPAALVEPAIAFWKTINIFRSVGWALLAPLLAYSVALIFRLPKIYKHKWVVLIIFVILWLLLSSTRAGGDIWDNPRYRLALLVPIARTAALSFEYGWRRKDHWFIRILLAELIFNLFFLQWYLSRYLNLFGRIDFILMIAIISLLLLGIIVQGIFHEVKINKRAKLKPLETNP
ncbi:MAG: hypothetical protein BGO78_04960 [Chloroflexi bacterium 44-23]|nr:MAG: hypothetical protein BGO78_04960 [Chloroflexi bacterium 44-23]